jgi:molecular chaperone HscB
MRETFGWPAWEPASHFFCLPGTPISGLALCTTPFGRMAIPGVPIKIFAGGSGHQFMSASSITAATSVTCGNCSAATGGAHFCPGCGKIQPLPRGADYFAFFGLPRKLAIDLADLEQRFHSLSWKLHPDNFVRASEDERQLSLDRSSQLNDAYRTLREPVARVEYLLGLAGMRKEGQKKQQAPPELLEEVFELNESLDELRDARESGGGAAAMAGLRTKLEAAQHKFESLLVDVDKELSRVTVEWDRALDSGADDTAMKKIMERMNEILNRRSYIRNLVASTQKELAGT